MRAAAEEIVFRGLKFVFERRKYRAIIKADNEVVDQLAPTDIVTLVKRIEQVVCPLEEGEITVSNPSKTNLANGGYLLAYDLKRGGKTVELTVELVRC
jgi:hypothetical protein